MSNHFVTFKKILYNFMINDIMLLMLYNIIKYDINNYILIKYNYF